MMNQTRTWALMGCVALAAAGSAREARAQVCPLTFAPAVAYPINLAAAVRSVAVADLNGDGLPDMVVVDFQRTFVRLGTGDGTFGPALINTVIAARSAAIADLNADGRPDLAVAASSGVAVLLGNGDGTFAPRVNYSASTNPVSVAAADVNGDAQPDLAVANSGGDNVSVLLGNSNGTFASAVNYSAGTQPSSVVIGDVSGDGLPDLVVANLGSDNVSVLVGNGLGVFAPAVNYGVGMQPSMVAIGDLNADGRRDLAVANQGSSDVSVLLGNGAGVLEAAVHYPSGGASRGLAIGDVNTDGRPDLAVGINANLAVLQGNGDGTFGAAQSFVTGGGANPAVVIVHLTGEGQADLVAANESLDACAVVLLNNSVLPLAITEHPDDLALAAGETAVFSVTVANAAHAGSYVWRLGGVPLTNFGRFSGVNTDTLTVASVSAFETGSFDCVVTGCNSVTSNAATLSIGAACAIDFNADGNVDADDLSDFITAYFTGC